LKYLVLSLNLLPKIAAQHSHIFLERPMMDNLDILIINPGKIRHDYVSEHLGVASLVAYTRSLGFRSDSLDMSIEKLTVEDAIPLIMNRQPRMIGVSLLEDSKYKGIALVKSLRNAGYGGWIITGGYFPTFSSQKLLRDFPEIDYVVRGEGELTLGELMHHLFSNPSRPVSGILGLSFRKNGKIIENPARPLIKDLDILPVPDRKYARVILKKGSRLRVSGTRGCWGNCSFCDIVALYGSSSGKNWRSRSVKNLVNEIQTLKERYQTDYFVFNDDQFLLPGKKAEERIAEFVTELNNRGLSIKFELMCRADTITREGMQKLKSVGLQVVFLGLESFDERQLKRFRKRISVRQNLKALITLYQLKIDVVASVILADAYTTIGDIVKQFLILFELKRRYFNSPSCQISINQCIEVYPGSAVYSEYQQQGLLTADDYMGKYKYRLKFWTRFRLKLFTLESRFFKLVFQPVEVIKNGLIAIKWLMRHRHTAISINN
jgi:radical SAM superfamily enzyme YgiQ (UPF0313 family)